MNFYEKECLSEKQVKALCSTFPDGNKYICETAGFIPLDVKFKQYEQNGMIAQFMASDFTSQDYRDMYLNPDFDISPEDDLEDVEEKRIALASHIQKIKEQVAEREAKKKQNDLQVDKPVEKVEKPTNNDKQS